MALKKTSDNGWALIEIVAIIFVSAIILPAIIIPFVEAVRDLDVPVVMGTLSFLAQEEMEKNVITYSYGDLVGWAETEISGFAGYSSVGNVIYVVEGDFDTEAAVDSGYRRITVTVSHGDKSLSLVTVKTDWTTGN